MNLFLSDGKRVETIEELDEFYNYVNSIITEIRYQMDSNGDPNIIIRKTVELHNAYGAQATFEDLRGAMQEHLNKILMQRDFIDEYQEEFSKLDIQVENALNESYRLARMLSNFEREVKEVMIERSIYNKEKNLINFLRIAGAVLIISGSLLWYYKLQRHIDERYSRSQSKKYKKETKNHFFYDKLKRLRIK
jgi:hypothetical protein